MVKGVRTGVGKYLAHGLKIRRASFTVRCISTNSRGMKQSGGEGRGARGGGGGGYFSLTSPSLCRPSFLSFYSGSRPWRWNNTGIAREKVLICRRGIIPLCMNIVKLFMQSWNRGGGGGGERGRRPFFFIICIMQIIIVELFSQSAICSLLIVVVTMQWYILVRTRKSYLKICTMYKSIYLCVEFGKIEDI